jgi:hypothetical protein
MIFPAQLVLENRKENAILPRPRTGALGRS